MLNLFNKFSNKKILLISALLLLLMVGVVVLYIFHLLSETIFTVLLFILVMAFTTLTSELFQRKFRKKLEDKKKGKVLTYNNELSFSKPLKTIKANYGNVSLYLEDNVLYALIKIVDAETFFSKEQQQIKYNVDTKKYNKLIQFYLFDIKDYNYFRQISIINYQSEKFYVGSFICDDTSKTFYQADNVKRNEEYEPIYNHFLELITFEK